MGIVSLLVFTRESWMFWLMGFETYSMYKIGRGTYYYGPSERIYIHKGSKRIFWKDYRAVFAAIERVRERERDQSGRRTRVGEPNTYLYNIIRRYKVMYKQYTNNNKLFYNDIIILCLYLQTLVNVFFLVQHVQYRS